MAGKGGGAWKVAYADFVTAMMALFMVLWLVGQNDKVKEAVAEHFRNPPWPSLTPLSPLREPAAGAGKFRPQPTVPLATDRPDDKPQKPKGIAIRGADRSGLGAIAFFETGSTELNAASRGALDQVAAIVGGKPQKIEIRAHASLQPMEDGQPAADPWLLCYQRSLAVREYLVQKGVSPERMRLSQAGVYEPFATKAAEGRADRNGRVEVLLLTEIAPPFKEAHEVPVSLEDGHGR